LKDVGTKQQIENFGVPKEDVDATHGLLNQVFSGLKKAGLTAAKTVGDWVGIGKGSEKPYSLKIGDKEVQVKNTQPEVVNGFYSPLEKVITETKFDKLPAKQWLEKFAKGEEAKWTGLTDWLNSLPKDQKLSRKEILDWLKENRIQVVEVVKGWYETPNINVVQTKSGNWSLKYDNGTFVVDSNGDNFKFGTKEDAELYLQNNPPQKSGATNTKFSQYQLEGEKSKYKEVLVTMPNNSKYQNELNRLSKKYNAEANYKSLRESKATDSELEILRNLNTKGEKFKSSHFDEPNILVHLRMNTRVDAEGNKVLFLEEVQSDWGQTGKKEGFKSTEYEDFENELRSKYSTDEFGRFKVSEIGEANAEKLEKLQRESNLKNTPTAPFVTETPSWVKLGLKVALKEAVKQGADKIAWTTGEQQNDRYDLSKQVDWINAEKTNKGDYKIEVGHKDNRPMETQYLKENELEANLGKELATKIINDGGGMYRGLDLKVGGKGMKGFYGSPTEGSLGIVGNVAKSLFKQEPKTVELQTTSTGIESQDKVLRLRDWVHKNKNEDYSYNDAQKDIENNSKLYQEYQKNIPTQHSIDITPELKASVEVGQPLFKDAEAQYRIESGKNIIEAIKDFNQSKNKARATVALTHEIMHPTVVSIIDGAKEGNEVGTKHTETIVNEFNKANPNSKVTVEDLIKGNDAFKDGTTSKQYRQVQEFIAKAWEKYHTEGGKGFSEAFQKVLDQITKAFQSVYKSITGKQLTPELKQMFDDILGKEAPTHTQSDTPTIATRTANVGRMHSSNASLLNRFRVGLFKSMRAWAFVVTLKYREKYKNECKKLYTHSSLLCAAGEDVYSNARTWPGRHEFGVYSWWILSERVVGLNI
jgi:hypothetical protein